MAKSNISAGWIFKMAWRDSRKNWARLLLFISSIILGIAALVAINSFGYNLKEDINGQAKTMLGADFVANSNQPIQPEMMQILDSIPGDRSSESSFASMIFFLKTDETRLVQIRALEGNFPYYGAIETTPAEAASTFRTGRKALVDHTLMLQFGAEIGDSIKVGTVNFVIEGRLDKVPGQAGIAATVAPAVYIPKQYLEETGLVQKGSRIVYKYYYKITDTETVDDVLAAVEDRFEEAGIRTETVQERKEDLGDTFDNLTGFLNLVAFVALLLGCVGVASAVHIYIKEKIPTVAILRCLGVKGSHTFLIYIIQIAFIGLIGASLGALLGTLIQFLLPQVFADFLPLEINLAVSWKAIAQGILTGVLISVLFALYPLLSIRNISPLNTLRTVEEETGSSRDPLRWLVYGLIILFVFFFAWLQIQQWKQAAYFTLGMIAAFLILAGVASIVMWLVKKFFPVSWSYLWRQSLANLFRPGNQTLVLIVSIGLGTALIATLYFIQALLISQVNVSDTGKQPNMVLFDIQNNQRDSIADLTRSFNLPVIQLVPIVTMRLEEINGKGDDYYRADSTLGVPNWAFTREYRVTYRDTLIDSEKVVQGEWRGTAGSADDTIYVSLEDRYAERMNIKVGDQLTFNVQGALVPTVVGSLRKIEWNRVQSNFLVVFPKGVLETAPQFHVLMTRVPSNELSAKFQQTLVKNYPNISVVDLALIISTVDEILNKVAFVIRFMALFSIITGMLVLVASVMISKYQRIKESVLLRTIGASRKQILVINSLEYFFLGSIASLTGIFLSLIGSWALAYFSFESTFVPDLLPILLTYLIITTLTVLIGLLNSRAVVNRPPLEVLREEVA